MIPKREIWNYFRLKKISTLLGGVTSKHDGDFYCLICHHSFRKKTRLESHKKVCEKKILVIF